MVKIHFYCMQVSELLKRFDAQRFVLKNIYHQSLSYLRSWKNTFYASVKYFFWLHNRHVKRIIMEYSTINNADVFKNACNLERNLNISWSCIQHSQILHGFLHLESEIAHENALFTQLYAENSVINNANEWIGGSVSLCASFMTKKFKFP